MERTYQRAGIDVHKSMLAVVAADAGQEGAFQFQRRKFHASQRVRATGGVAAAGACTGSRDGITAQYGRPVWQERKGNAICLWPRRSLARRELVESHMQILEQSVGQGLQAHRDAVQRLAEAPGFGVDSATQAIAEAGPTAGSFSTAPELCSWVGVCAGREESAEVSKSNRSPKGNRMRRHLPHAGWGTRRPSPIASAASRGRFCSKGCATSSTGCV